MSSRIFEEQMKEGLILARMPEFQYKVIKAKNDIAVAMQRCTSPYVALSWGKQSIVLMHLVYSVSNQVPGVFWKGPESNIIADFDNVRDLFLSRFLIPYFELFCAEDFKKTASEWAREQDKDCVFMGLVQFESKARKLTLSKANSFNIFYYKTTTRGVKIRSCPLASWTNQDIVAYTASNNLPVLNTYKKFGFDVRTAARIKLQGKSFTQLGFDLLSESQKKRLIESQNERAKIDE
jgi:3'-phosphoadenosine 5'-phosphosulfate sulfotransferase (PAPS reductase)/FAD synthetase